MALIEPNTQIMFLQVPLDPEYRNTLYFTSKAEQETYFGSKAIRVEPFYSYQRKSNNVIRVGWVPTNPSNTVISALYACNYIMFKNASFENKWFYAFVTNIEYVNNNAVDISYEIDVMQTWHFDYIFNDCTIEREHTTTDAIGEHTLSEPLSIKEYFEKEAAFTLDGVSQTGRFKYTPAVCFLTSFRIVVEGLPVPPENPGAIISGLYDMGNTFTGCYYTIVPLIAANISPLQNLLTQITESNKISGVLGIFIMPYEFRNNIGQTQEPFTRTVKYLNFDIRTLIGNELKYSLGNYIPRNKKLLTHPFNMLYVTNFQGTKTELKWENFSNINQCRLDIWCDITSGGAMVIYPWAYKSVGQNFDEAMTTGSFPMCSWTYDAFKAWVAQNTGQMVATGVSIVASLLATIASEGALAPALVGSIATAGAMGAKAYQASTMPPQAESNKNSNAMYSASLLTFGFYKKYVKEEYAIKMDAFFDMYGYKTERTGIPNRAARPCYSYIKTVDCSLDGNVPVNDLRKIEAIFDKGVRFWKKTAVFGSYDPSVNNNTVQ